MQSPYHQRVSAEMVLLAWALIVIGVLLAIPGMLFPPMGVFGLAVAFGGFLLRRKAREIAMRRQQGRGLLD